MIYKTLKLKVVALSQLSTVNGERHSSLKDCAGHLVRFLLYTITQKHRAVQYKQY